MKSRRSGNGNFYLKLVMVGNIKVRKLVGQVSDEIKIRGMRIEDLAERIKSIEEIEASLHDRIKKLEDKGSNQ